MKKLSIKLLLIVPILFYTVDLSAQPDFELIQQHIDQRLAADDFLGISIGYVSRTGKSHFIHEGSIDTARTLSVNKNSIFEIGSISKTFTALIAVKMDEEGLLSLDTPVNTLLPDSVHIAPYKGHKITIKHLATHTSGLPRLPTNLNPEDPLNPYADYTVDLLYRFLNDYKLTSIPGTKFTYSNLGIGLLGHLLEQQSNKSYSQLLQQYITGPLEMEDTGLSVPDHKKNRLAAPYNFGAPAKYWDFSTLAGAGGIHSTAADMTTYIKAQLEPRDTGLASAINKTHEIQFDADSGPTDAIGLGWLLSTTNDTIIWHNGGTGGFHSFVGFNKEEHTAVVVLANGRDRIDDIGFHLLDKRHALKKVPEAISIDPATLDSYTGTYAHKSGIKYFVSRKGAKLMVQISGQSIQRVFPKSQNRFYYKTVPAEIEFTENKQGTVTGLRLYQNGMEIQSKKVSNRILKN